MECSFCGREIRRGLESIYVTSKGKMLYFCSSKCDKNLLKLGRSRRRTKWTKTYRKEKEARLKLLKEGVKPDKIRELEKEMEKLEKKAESEIKGEEKPAEKEVETQNKPEKQKEVKRRKEKK